jgi:hypothetical protein
MEVERLFRTLAFQADGKDIERGPQARGTLALLKSPDKHSAKFIRDVDGDVLEMEIASYDVFAGVPTHQNVILLLPDGKRHTFIAYRELPAAEATRFTVVSAGVNPTVRYET